MAVVRYPGDNDGMEDQYGTWVNGQRPVAAWGNDVQATIDDKLSLTYTTNPQSVAGQINQNGLLNMGANIDLNAFSLVVDSGGDKILSATELAYLDGLNQNLTTTSDVQFLSITLGSPLLTGVVLANAGKLEGGADTDDLTQGTTNLYFTEGLVNDAIAVQDGITKSWADPIITLGLTDIPISKLLAGGDAQIIVGAVTSGVPTYRTMSGDGLLSNTGILTVNHPMSAHSGTLAHTSLSGVTTSQHHTKYVLTNDLASTEITAIKNINTNTISVNQWSSLGTMPSIASAQIALWDGDNAAVTGYYILGWPELALLIEEETNTFDWQSSVANVYAHTNTPSTYFHMGVHLPHGATLTQFDVYGQRTTGNNTLVTLSSRGRTSSVGSVTHGTINLGAGMGNVNSSMSTTVDNNNNYYYIRVLTSGGAGEHRIRSIRITYTVKRPQP